MMPEKVKGIVANSKQTNNEVTKCSIEPTLPFPEVIGDYDCQEREVEVVFLSKICVFFLSCKNVETFYLNLLGGGL